MGGGGGEGAGREEGLKSNKKKMKIRRGLF